MKQEIEDVYKQVTQVEHVLIRPDTYIGSTELGEVYARIWDEQQQKIIYKDIQVSQGLYKIFDEILVNAADNYQRDNGMKELRVNIGVQEIMVENDGNGIPIQMHKKCRIWVPEMIFGVLLTSSNYDDSVKKVTGGRNGFGAKLTNIFSKRFIVETGDRDKYFRMIWYDNMQRHDEAEIKQNTGKAKDRQFTRITFQPDFKRFEMKQLTDDMISLLQRRVVDMAGILAPNVKVYLNGQLLRMSGFQDYVKLYGVENFVFTQWESNDRMWYVAVAQSDGQFNQVSFVNSIDTVRGGTHVNHVADQIVESLVGQIKKKNKDFKGIKAFQVKQHMMIFINCQIENPAFDSQTKETLTTKQAQFGSSFVLQNKFIDEIIKKTQIIENILLSMKNKLDTKLAKQLTGKKQSRLLGIEKLEDANLAGTKQGDQCTLIITEGDSAKSLAMAGLEIVGRDRWGVFPLRGKLLNVRDASHKQIMENKEIEYLVKILGLQFNKQYESTKALRYGSLMIMTDQDVDGHHIKGLILNLFDKFWPSLFKYFGFLKCFVTPLIKVSRKSGNEGEINSFFSIGDYKRFVENNTCDISKYRVKYYKGLGTSTDVEGQQYFSQLNKHVKQFKYEDINDSECIDLVFSKTKSDARKEWLIGYSWENMDDTFDYNQSVITYNSFITQSLALYSVSDNIRSIPSMMDGFKPTQRKILYTLLSHPSKNEYKVSSLSGLVSSFTNYHHGDQSLTTTIVSMAQDFTGSNNINLLLPLGQFGSRQQGGKDAAQARYISTKLSQLTLNLFKDDDLHTLSYWEEEGIVVEPKYFIPILPMVLINGAEGIGTGWMTHVPMYNIREISQQILNKLKDNSYNFYEPTPWYKGYIGEIQFQNQSNSFILHGCYHRSGDQLFITEVPIKRLPKDLQSLLQLKMQGDEPDILDLKEHHCGNKICFEVQFRDNVLQSMSDEQLQKYLKITTNININNIVLFNSEGKLHRYNGAAEVIHEFYNIRLQHYQMRLKYLISKLKYDLDIAQNKSQFLNQLLNQQLVLFGKTKQEIIDILKKKNFTQYHQMEQIHSTKKNIINHEIDSKEEGYNYLLNMPMWSISLERVEENNQKLKKLQQEYDKLQSTTPQQLWESDINEILKELDKNESIEQQQYIKRLSKNSEEILKGGSNLLQSSQSTQQYYDSDDSEDDYDQVNKKKNKKFRLKVLNDFCNLGIVSKGYIKKQIEFNKNIKKTKLSDTNNINIELDIEIDENQIINNSNQQSFKVETALENENKTQIKKTQNNITKKNRLQKNLDYDSEELQSNEDEEQYSIKDSLLKTKKQKKDSLKGKQKNLLQNDSENLQKKQTQNKLQLKKGTKHDLDHLVQNNQSSVQQVRQDKTKPLKQSSSCESEIIQENDKKIQKNYKKIKTNPIILKIDDSKQEIVKEKSAEDQLYEKYGIDQFLKYLKNDNQIDQNNKNEKDPKDLSLADRLILRQQQNNIDIYTQSYNQAKNEIKPIIKTSNNNNIVDDDFLQFLF